MLACLLGRKDFTVLHRKWVCARVQEAEVKADVPASITSNHFQVCWKCLKDLRAAIADVPPASWSGRLEALKATVRDEEAETHLFNKANPAHELALWLLFDDAGDFFDVEQGKLLGRFDELMKCALVEYHYLEAVSEFESKKATLPVASLTAVLPLHVLQTMAAHVNVTSESALKSKDLKLKGHADTNKDFIDRMKATLGNTEKSIQKYNSELVKKEKNKDKERVAEDKKAQMAEKAGVKAVRQLCKDTKSPGLLSYCGKVVSDVTHYCDLAAFETAKMEATFDPSVPYVVDNASSLFDLVEGAQLIKASFGNFRAQVPHTTLAAQKKKVARQRLVRQRVDLVDQNGCASFE